MQTITINGRSIGKGFKPYVIAEMSGNHNHSLERALRIIEKAAEAGVDAIKLQTYTADTMTLDLAEGDFLITDPHNLWHGYSLYQLYKEAHTPWEWHKPIFEKCKQLGLTCFSTPFDHSAVDFLESLDVPCYKISSFECTDLSLVRKAASTGKPLIISTGMATAAEIDETVRAARDAGCKDIILLKCTSTYPASPESSHLLTIPHMQQLFQCQSGLSDHTLGIGVSVAAVALGATVIEKHLTLSRRDGGVDAAFSLEVDEMKKLVEEVERAWLALGEVTYGATAEEEGSKQGKRTLYVVQDMKAGDVITEQNLRAIRPGYGLPVKYYDILLGKKVNQNLRKGTAMSWDYI